MAQVAYCSQCGKNVYVTPDGRCPQGHGPEYLSNYSESTDQPPPTDPGTGIPQAPPPGASMPPADATYGAPPPQKKSKVGLIIGIILLVFVLCGIGVGVVTCMGIRAAEDVGESLQEQALVEDTADVVEEGVQPDAERMVNYFFPGFTLVDLALADTDGDTGTYHILVQSTDAPDFYMTFFAERTVMDGAGGQSDDVTYFDDTADVMWENWRALETGLAEFAGPASILPEDLRLDLMESFGEIHADLNVTEWEMNNDTHIIFRGIADEDLDAWYDDFTSFESVWEMNDDGRWEETSFSQTSDE